MTAWKTTPEYQEIPQPDPGPGQVLVKVGAAGICHSDVHVIHEFDAGVFNAELPFTLGHENAGLGRGARAGSDRLRGRRGGGGLRPARLRLLRPLPDR